jgi:hypothetical protein
LLGKLSPPTDFTARSLNSKPPNHLLVHSMCRDILNSCVRNTEEAEKNFHVVGLNGESGRGLGKGVWGMIEESKLAKTIRKGEEKMVKLISIISAPGTTLMCTLWISILPLIDQF